MSYDPKTLQELSESLYRQVMARRDALVEAFVADTGCRPSECMLVETVEPTPARDYLLAQRDPGAVARRWVQAAERLEQRAATRGRLGRGTQAQERAAALAGLARLVRWVAAVAGEDPVAWHAPMPRHIVRTGAPFADIVESARWQR